MIEGRVGEQAGGRAEPAGSAPCAHPVDGREAVSCLPASVPARLPARSPARQA